MIRSDKELVASRRKVREAEDAIAQLEGPERATLERFVDEVRSEVEDFEAIRSGSVTGFKIRGLDDLGEALIKARIAKGWTQRQLAEALDVSQQQVQKDEARSYERASTTRLAEVADVLGYELHGLLLPSGSNPIQQNVGSFAFRALPVEVTQDETLLNPPGLRVRFSVNSVDLMPGQFGPAARCLGHFALDPAAGPPSKSARRVTWTTASDAAEDVTCD